MRGEGSGSGVCSFDEERVYTTSDEAPEVVDSHLKVGFPGVEAPQWTCGAQREAVLQMMFYNGGMDLNLPTGFGN
jgi:hypothetical protein